MNTHNKIFSSSPLWLCGISAGILLFLLLTPTVFTQPLTLYLDVESAGFQTADADATLSSLAIDAVPLNELFSPEKRMYTAETLLPEVTVTAVAAHAAATVSITPSDMNAEKAGHQVAIGEGTTIGVTVTAEDGTTAIYTVTVTRPTAGTDETVPLIASEPEADTQTDDDIGTITRIIGTPGNTEVTITWATSSITGVTGWEFDYKTQAGSWTGWADVPSSTASTTSHLITSLTNGTAYSFRIKAKGTGAIRGTAAETVATPNTNIPATDFDSNDNNLIEITTLAQLDAMRYDLNGDSGATGDTAAKNNAYYSAFKTSRVGFFCDPGPCIGYELMNELDFDTDDDGSTYTGTVTHSNGDSGITGDSGDAYYNGGAGWKPIATFGATFDGNGFVIRNLFIKRSSDSAVGLFGRTNGAAVLTEVALQNVFVSGGDHTGTLVGANRGGTVRASYSTGSVIGGTTVGGLVGNSSGTIVASYSTVSVIQKGTKPIVAGFLGLNWSEGESVGLVKNSYSTGLVTAGESDSVEGFIAQIDDANTEGNYWDAETSGRTGTYGGYQ